MVNDRAETSVSGFFVAGEVAGSVHGKNRLMGNSVRGYSVFGKRAGVSTAEYARGVFPRKLTLDHVAHYSKMLTEEGVKTSNKAPILLPDYREKRVLSRSLDIL